MARTDGPRPPAAAPAPRPSPRSPPFPPSPTAVPRRSRPAPPPRRLVLSNELGHVIDGGGQVASLVRARRQRHRAEISRGDQSRPPFQLQDAPRQALADAERQRHRRQSESTADQQRRPDGFP